MGRDQTTLRTVLIVGAVAILALVAWQITHILLLVFAALVVATILRSLADLIARGLPVGETWSLLLACVLIALLVGAFVYVLGAQIAAQFEMLVTELPRQIAALETRLGIPRLPERLAEEAEQFLERGGVLQRVAGITSNVVGALASIGLVLVAGLYFAARPGVYRAGLLKLVPPGIRPRIETALASVAGALRLWLVGQFISMVLVGVLTTAGLYALGLSSALALGFLTAIAEFVPIVGPVLAAIPAVLLGFSEGGQTLGLGVLALFVVIQQIEGNVIMPLVQRRMVELPPALTLFGLLALGVLFGPLGVILGAPLMVVAFVAVKQLYVRDTLKESTTIPGEPEHRGDRTAGRR